MHVLIAGGSGFLGRALASVCRDAGHQVSILSRRAPSGSQDARAPRVVTWSPDGRVGPWSDACTNVDAVINLAGESIAAGRWTTARKRALVDSRLLATRSLAAFVAGAAHRPSVFLSSSAVGFYGNRGNETLDENAAPGSDFLAGLAVEWERAALEASSARTRVVLLRTGIVLDPAEGALAKMLPPFRLGVGGPFGLGRQYMSWIHRDDWVRLAAWCLTAGVSGPVNLVAPGAVTNAEFARTLGRVLRRPSLAMVPPFVLKILLGEMAGPLLLNSQRAVPAAAVRAGFTFTHPHLEPALRQLLG
jgi:uncharacterized protein (TIGR01777 family)